MSERANIPSTGMLSSTATPFGLSVILVCGLVYLLDGLVHTIIGPLAPDVARDLQLSYAELGPIFSANLMGQCFGLVTVPLLVDRFGHRRITIFTLLGFGTFQALTGIAQDGQQLFLLRMATGVFLGGCLPSCLAIVTWTAPVARRGLAITMLFTGYGLGATAAGVIAGAFVLLGGWRVASIAVGVVCLLSAIAAHLWLAEPDRRPLPSGAEISRGARGALAIFSSRYLVGTLMLWLLFISMLTISYCLNSWLPTLLVEVGRGQSFAAMSVSVFSLGGLVSALGVGLLIDLYGTTRVLVSSLSIATLLLYLIGQVLASASTPFLLILLAVGGFFFYGAYGGVNVVLASYYPDHIRAVGIGWTKSIGRVGTFTAPIMIGFGLSGGVPETVIMSLFAVPACLSALALLVIAVANSRK